MFAERVARSWRLQALVQADSLAAARAVLAQIVARKEPVQEMGASLLLAEGCPDSALATLEKSGDRIRLSVRGQETRARSLRALGRLPEAATTLEGLLKRNGCRFIARHQLGQIYEEMGRKADAAREYEVFLKAWEHADPGWPQVDDARRRLAALRASH